MLKSTVWAQFVLAMLKSTFLSTTNYRHADTLGGLGSAARDSVSIAVVGFWSLSTTPMLTPPCGAQPTTDMLKPSLGAQLSPAMLKPTFGAKLVLAILKSTFFLPKPTTDMLTPSLAAQPSPPMLKTTF
jgi:hypothetical protein